MSQKLSSELRQRCYKGWLSNGFPTHHYRLYPSGFCRELLSLTSQSPARSGAEAAASKAFIGQTGGDSKQGGALCDSGEGLRWLSAAAHSTNSVCSRRNHLGSSIWHPGEDFPFPFHTLTSGNLTTQNTIPLCWLLHKSIFNLPKSQILKAIYSSS